MKGLDIVYLLLYLHLTDVSLSLQQKFLAWKPSTLDKCLTIGVYFLGSLDNLHHICPHNILLYLNNILLRRKIPRTASIVVGT